MARSHFHFLPMARGALLPETEALMPCLGVPNRITIAVGSETALVDRVKASTLASVTKEVPDITRIVVDPSNDEAAANIAQACAPTLFGEDVLVVIEGIDDLDDDGSGYIILTHLAHGAGPRDMLIYRLSADFLAFTTGTSGVLPGPKLVEARREARAARALARLRTF